MPKKAPKNAFFYYMQDFKQEQQEKGINYGSLADVAKAADPEWRNATPQVRAQYEARAKQEKQRRHIPIQKLTSTGVPISEIEAQQKELQDAAEYEIQDIKNMIKTKTVNRSILKEDFYVIDVNYYCKAGNNFLIAESTVLRFNLTKGYIDCYPEMVNPGHIPIGYAFDVKQGCIDFGLKMPDESTKSDYMQILANIIDYLKQKDPSEKTLPPLYTMPDKVLPVQDFIQQMCQMTGEDEYLFRVYKLDTLFFHLINGIKSAKDEGFPKESLALVQLKKDPFKYNPGLGCEHHETTDKAIECTTSRTKRWAFTILDSCCPVVGIAIVPGQHVPVEYDVEGIIELKDSRRGWCGPSVAGAVGPSSCNSSYFDQDVMSNVSSLSERPVVRKAKRANPPPVRPPHEDYARNIRVVPELTEDDFPALSASRGRGSGRSLSGSFGKMNLRK